MNPYLSPTRYINLYLLAVVMAIALMLQACAGTPTATANDKEAIALRSITAMRTSATMALRAGKITVADDQQIQLRADQLRAAVIAARVIADPIMQDQSLKASKQQADAETTKLGGTIP